ncbi:MAG: carboxypeptidase-like regulatory domain-containing protein [Ignavibacteria bacterium]|nr:carboxypeptidase-like regulatory domain-containing protein [Ignavibacteria bacterium]
MRYSWFTVLLILLIILAIPALLFAGNGKISGTVKDATTKETVVGANVVVVGTMMGAATDAEGRYYILNVPPGTYSIQVSTVGYARMEIGSVQVRADQTTDLNFDLRQETIELKEVVIQAQMRVVDKSQTSSKSTIGKDELSNKLPINSVLEVLNTTPGAFKGYIRGGKITETKTIVDGVDVSDQYYLIGGDQSNQGILYSSGLLTRYRNYQLSSNASVNFNAVEQLSVNTGAVGADNASATAGLINYALREGRGKLTGSFSAKSSQPGGLKYVGPDLYGNDVLYFNEKNATNRRLDSMKALQAVSPTAARQTAIIPDSIKSGKYTYYQGKYLNQDKPQIDIDGMISGSITDDWGFLLSGRYFDTHGRLPNEHQQQADLTFKTTYNLSREFKLNAFAIVNDKGQLFGWKDTYYNDKARHFLEAVPKSDGINVIGSLKATHVLSPSTFYEVQLSHTYRNDRYGFCDDNNDGIAALNEDGEFLTLEKTADANKYISPTGTDLGKFFRIGDENVSFITVAMNAGNAQTLITRPTFIYENTTNAVSTAKFDITSQVDFNNQIKAGLSFQFNDISRVQRNSSLGANSTDALRRLLVEHWEFYPTLFGGYIQDRMEYAGLVINLGARIDRWDPKAADYANYYNLFLTQSILVDDSVRKELVINRSNKNVSPYWFFSPRIGVSHPISDEAAMYFSYSRNSIPPPYSRLYGSYNAVLGSGGGFPSFPSMRQEPVRSSNYEIGAQWEFIPRKFGLSFTAYMRDIQNYSQNQLTMSLANGSNSVWISSQYADARGVEFGLQALRQTYFDLVTLYGRLNYSYSYIKGTGWTSNDPLQQSTFSRPDTMKYGNSLPFDDFWSYNKVEVNVTGGSNLLTGGYDRAHRITYVLFLEFPYQIMLSSIGTFQSGFYYPLSLTADPRVAGRAFGQAPWNKQVDIRVEKGFTIENIRFAVYFDMKNVFKWTNIIGYDNTVSGAALWEYSNAGMTTLNNGTPDPTGTFKRAVYYDGSPFYDIPREYFFGVRIDF